MLVVVSVQVHTHNMCDCTLYSTFIYYIHTNAYVYMHMQAGFKLEGKELQLSLIDGTQLKVCTIMRRLIRNKKE